MATKVTKKFYEDRKKKNQQKLNAILSNVPSGMESIAKGIVDRYNDYLNKIQSYYETEDEMAEIAKEAGFSRNTAEDRSRAKEDLTSSLFNESIYMEAHKDEIPNNLIQRWQVCEKKQREKAKLVKEIKEDYKKLELTIGRAKKEAEKNYLAANDKTIQELNNLIRSDDLEIQALAREKSKIRTAQLQVKQHKAPTSKQTMLERGRKAEANLRKQQQEDARLLKVITDKNRISKLLAGGKGTSMKKGEAFGIESILDTGIQKDGSRAHQMYHVRNGQKYSTVFGQEFRTPSAYASFAKKGWGEPLSKDQETKMKKAANFGTLHHRIVEDVLKKNLNPSGSNGTLTTKDLENYVTGLFLSKRSQEDLADIEPAINGKGISQSVIQDLVRTTNSFFK